MFFRATYWKLQSRMILQRRVSGYLKRWFINSMKTGKRCVALADEAG